MADELPSLSSLSWQQGEYLPEVEEEDFYEQIAAPKYVDLTKPDPRRSGDDRYWFCLRAGCDQKHEEEMDSEAIYKSFLLRVMAARSPNVKLRKALCNKDKSTTGKCPQTVPAKPSRPRLALISSISKRLVDAKVKFEPLPKQKTAATPKAMPKQSRNIAKALTTPSKKKPEPASPFRSVRNPKSAAGLPKKMGIAKTLVFHSPKKQVKTKTSSEEMDSMKTLCSGMKKLEITSGKKEMMRSTTAALDARRKQPRGREVKSRVYNGLHTPTQVVKQAKSSKNLETSLMMLQHNSGNAARIGVHDDPSNEMKIKEKCRNGASGKEYPVDTVVEKRAGEEALTSASNGREIHCEAAAEGDDKENASASDENRRLDLNEGHHGKHILENQDNSKCKTTRRTMAKPLKGSSVAPAAMIAQGLKHRKPKPTHPKPFRLRTDERGILKEAANMEKKLRHPTPLQEFTTVPQRRHHQHFQRNEKKSLEQTEEKNNRPQREQPQNEASGLRNPKGRVTTTKLLSSQKKAAAIPRRTPTNKAAAGQKASSRTPLKKAKSALSPSPYATPCAEEVGFSPVTDLQPLNHVTEPPQQLVC